MLGSIDAPWAKDANGKAVQTTYRLEGGSLVQKVTTTADIEFSKAEVKALNNKIQYADTSAAACALLVVPAAAVGCAGRPIGVPCRLPPGSQRSRPAVNPHVWLGLKETGNDVGCPFLRISASFSRSGTSA